MKITAEALSEQIPYYLTAHQKEGLVKALSEFPNCNYYTNFGPDEMLQGDSWTKLKIFNFTDGTHRLLKGIFLTNSCDMDPANGRALSPKVTFAPIIPLKNYRRLLEQSGVKNESINSKFQDIKKQAITSIFYLPQGGNLEEDYIALLEDVHSMPLNSYLEIERRAKMFTLSQVGFYLFLMKLSIHFCRMHEAVFRIEKNEGIAA